jgi:hypothetical protein
MAPLKSGPGGEIFHISFNISHDFSSAIAEPEAVSFLINNQDTGVSNGN